MRFIRVLGLGLVALALPLAAGVAAADPRFNVLPATDPRVNVVGPGDPRVNVVAPGDPRVSPAVRESFDRFDGRDRDRRPGHRPGEDRAVIVVPQTVIVTPNRCWQPGYWTYQFVPQYYTYSAWVAGQWSPDGRWIDGHYAPAQYTSGYYQPLWVEGYYTSCG
jgi:hypothetical protein